jgi:two-component system alkaline phosphatase synthesis response regulator PhoP
MKKILIADDDRDLVVLLTSRLRANGYEVITASSGVWVVTEAVKQKPDLVILDIKMPSGSGVSVFEQLKKYIKTLFIPVIFITAYPSDYIREKVMEMGAEDFITKPFDPDELVFKVKKALGDLEE